MPAFWGNIAKKTSLRSASQARRQDSVTGGHKQILEGLKIYFEPESMDQKTKFFIAKFHKIWSRPKKKGLHLKICANFYEFWDEDKKKALHLNKMRQFSRIPG